MTRLQFEVWMRQIAPRGSILSRRATPLLGAFLLASAAALPARAQAVIEGTVQLPKPSAASVAPPRYPNQPVQPGPADPPAAVVYLDLQTAGSAPVRTVKMGQRALQFAPGLLPILRGTLVEFPNFDDLYHNVFSYSKAKRFDLGRYRKDEKPATQQFDKPGVVRVSCEIHPHMQGVILVLETPYFVKTGADGRYRLEGLPPGKHVLKAWLSEKQILEAPVQLDGDTKLRVDFPRR
jgi:plastocyanin